MSEELMKSKFVRRLSSVVRPSVCVAIISEPNARISFKFHLWLLLDYSQNHFLFEKKDCFWIFMNIFRFR